MATVGVKGLNNVAGRENVTWSCSV